MRSPKELTDCPGHVRSDFGGPAVADTSDIRTPAQIEADIKRRREVLAETLDEIGVRVHPKTIVGDAKAKVVSNIDHTLGRAYVSVNKAVTEVKAQFEEGRARRPRRRGTRGAPRPRCPAPQGLTRPRTRAPETGRFSGCERQEKRHPARQAAHPHAARPRARAAGER